MDRYGPDHPTQNFPRKVGCRCAEKNPPNFDIEAEVDMNEQSGVGVGRYNGNRRQKDRGSS